MAQPMGDREMRRRCLIVVASYAVLSGVLICGFYQRVGFLHTTVAALVVLAAGIAVGAYVRGWWMLLALAGPLIALGYLEVSGFVETSDDRAAEPLLSPPGFSVFFIFALILLLGRGLGEGADWVVGAWRRRGPRRGVETPVAAAVCLDLRSKRPHLSSRGIGTTEGHWFEKPACSASWVRGYSCEAPILSGHSFLALR